MSHPEELPPPILAYGIPCKKCEVPDSWYQAKEDGHYTRFLWKCHSCQHEWTSTRNHRTENKKKKQCEQNNNTSTD